MRSRYWRIYYGDDDVRCQSTNFLSNESKRLCQITKKMRKLSCEHVRPTYKQPEGETSNPTGVHDSQELLASLPTHSLRMKILRRCSTPAVGIFHPTYVSADAAPQALISDGSPFITVTQH
jgi:hypothetical protein